MSEARRNAKDGDVLGRKRIGTQPAGNTPESASPNIDSPGSTPFEDSSYPTAQVVSDSLDGTTSRTAADGVKDKPRTRTTRSVSPELEADFSSPTADTSHPAKPSTESTKYVTDLPKDIAGDGASDTETYTAHGRKADYSMPPRVSTEENGGQPKAAKEQGNERTIAQTGTSTGEETIAKQSATGVRMTSKRSGTGMKTTIRGSGTGVMTTTSSATDVVGMIATDQPSFGQIEDHLKQLRKQQVLRIKELDEIGSHLEALRLGEEQLVQQLREAAGLAQLPALYDKEQELTSVFTGHKVLLQARQSQ